MSDELHPADRILGAGWRPKVQVLLEDAWTNHPQRELLDALAAERDEHGLPSWQARLVEDGFGVYEFAPLDPRDEREPVHLFAWPLGHVDIDSRDARAVVDEHDESIDVTVVDYDPN